ncbi:MAG TPA: hypothetical protein VHI52_09715 [Verrucomicrobiae bacterium]|nr:hypothetical protein [Verrucomicrobiae bacterium]
MNLDGRNFLDTLARLSADTFENHFAAALTELGMDGLFDRNELMLLFDASAKAFDCNLALNSGARQAGSEDEAKRHQLEQEFMIARDSLFASPGWQDLDAALRKPIEDRFLQVAVRDEQLSW